MNKIYFYGASGHGKVVLDAIIAQGNTAAAFIDDNHQIKTFLGYQVDHVLPDNAQTIIAIGDNAIRKNISERFDNSLLTTVIHPTATISWSAIIGKGTLVGVHAVINAAARVGANCIINSAAIIEHDCVIDDHVHISPHATLCGNVSIGEGTHVGAGQLFYPV